MARLEDLPEFPGLPGRSRTWCSWCGDMDTETVEALRAEAARRGWFFGARACPDHAAYLRALAAMRRLAKRNVR